MNRIDTKKEKWIINRYLAGMPARKIATHLQISVRTIYKKISNYKKLGEKSFEIQEYGRSKATLNPGFKQLVQDEWKIFQCGSVKLHKIMKNKGFGVSQRKIQQTMDECSLTAPCPKRRGQRKYCSYRWPEGFRVLHTDWTMCPITGKQLIAYIDDHSRFIVGYGLYDGATTENTLDCLYRILFEHGIPYAIITDRGSHFYANRMGKKEKGRCKFEEVLEEMGIKHIVARPRHPQTNGKIERWFGIYKREFNDRFKDIHEYVKFYNENRLHQRLGYRTPAEVFFKKKLRTNNEIVREIDGKKKS